MDNRYLQYMLCTDSGETTFTQKECDAISGVSAAGKCHMTHM